MEPIVDMRVSRVAPVVEGNLVELVDMVKQMGRKGDLTESQNRKMVSYLGNLDEMRSQIVIMVQRYENDEKVLKRLLDLLDRIDDVKGLAVASQSPISPDLSNDAPDYAPDDKEIARQYDTPFNPLMVSTLNILDVSGLFADNIRDEDVEEDEEEEEEGEGFWDHNDDLSALAPEDDGPREISSINLSISNLHLPALFETPAQSPIIGKQPEKAKGKGKEARRKGKGKAKATRKGKEKAESDTGSSSESDSERESESDSGTETESESEVEGASSSKPPRRFGFKLKKKAASSSSNRKNIATSLSTSSVSSSGSESESESAQSSSDDGGGASNSRIPFPPPMPKKIPKGTKKGPCDPVLCKICYDEYNKLEDIWNFKECGHVYCRDCLNDYLTTNINEGAVLDLVCPFPDCDTEILPHDINSLCTKETIDKFERFTVLAALRADPNARWCPNPYCNNGIPHNAATMPWVYCNACKFEFCFHCMAERHDGVACGKEALEYLEKKRQSEAAAIEQFNEWTGNMKAFVKPCPSCKSFIEKNDGCNHMTCGNQTCRAQFCWLCLNLYASDHFQNDIDFPNCYDKQYWTPPEMMGGPPNAIAYPHHHHHHHRTRRFANIAKKVGIYMGVGVAVVTLGVPAAVIGGPVYGCFQLHKRLKAKRARRPREGGYHGEEFVPPSPARIAEAAREARRLYELEHS